MHTRWTDVWGIYIHNSNNNGDDGQSPRRRYLLMVRCTIIQSCMQQSFFNSFPPLFYFFFPSSATRGEARPLPMGNTCAEGYSRQSSVSIIRETRKSSKQQERGFNIGHLKWRIKRGVFVFFSRICINVRYNHARPPPTFVCYIRIGVESELTCR
jgi:hypothetical protein